MDLIARLDPDVIGDMVRFQCHNWETLTLGSEVGIALNPLLLVQKGLLMSFSPVHLGCNES